MSVLRIIGFVGTVLISTASLAQQTSQATSDPIIAQNSGGEFYLAPRLNFGASDVSDFRISPDQGGTLAQKQEGAEFVAGASIAFGYKWDTEDLPLRIEGQYYYRYHYDLNLRVTNGRAGTVDYDNETVAHAGLVQGYWHADIDQLPFEPYIGLSLGAIWNHTVSDRRANAGGTSEVTTNRINLAYGGGLGVWWDFSENLSLDVGYRYLDLGDIQTDRYPTGERVETGDYGTHDVYIGVAYRF